MLFYVLITPNAKPITESVEADRNGTMQKGCRKVLVHSFDTVKNDKYTTKNDILTRWQKKILMGLEYGIPRRPLAF